MNEKLKGFPSCYVISLDTNTDRRDYIVGEFDRLGINSYNILQYPRYIRSESDYIVNGQSYLIDRLSYDNHLGVLFSHLLTIKWWYENTVEDVCAVMEDDIDFTTVKYWNFTYQEFIDRLGGRWDCLQLSASFQLPFVMYPRVRTDMDNGAICYIIKRSYAEKIVKYYFGNNGEFILKHPRQYSRRKEPFKNYEPYDRDTHESEFYETFGRISTENLIYGLGLVYIFCLFNYNMNFDTTNHIESTDRHAAQRRFQQRSHDYVNNWWKIHGSKGTLGDIFNINWHDLGDEDYNVLHIDP